MKTEKRKKYLKKDIEKHTKPIFSISQRLLLLKMRNHQLNASIKHLLRLPTHFNQTNDKKKEPLPLNEH